MSFSPPTPRTFQAILQSLLGRVAPATVSRVDSINAHTIASQLLQESGFAFRIDGLEAQRVRRCLESDRSLQSAVRSARRYWEEEIADALTGRGPRLHRPSRP